MTRQAESALTPARGVFLVVTILGLLWPHENCRASSFQVDPTDNTGLGYLIAPSLSPGHILRPSSLFSCPAPSLKGSWNAGVDVHWGNVWTYNPEQYLIDGEWIRCNTRLHYSMTDSMSAGLLIPVVGRNGGFADSMIEEFHKIFRLSNAEREQFPRNKCRMQGTLNGETLTITEGSSWGIGDLAPFIVLHWEGTRARPSITLQGQVSFPTGDEDEVQGLGDPSAGISLLSYKRLWTGPVIIFGGCGFSCCRADEIAGLQIRKEVYSGLLGFEYEYSSSVSLIVQYLGSSAIAKDYAAFSDPCHEVSTGVKWWLNDSFTLEFAVTENVAIFENSTDIGAHLSFAHQF